MDNYSESKLNDEVPDPPHSSVRSSWLQSRNTSQPSITSVFGALLWMNPVTKYDTTTAKNLEDQVQGADRPNCKRALPTDEDKTDTKKPRTDSCIATKSVKSVATGTGKCTADYNSSRDIFKGQVFTSWNQFAESFEEYLNKQFDTIFSIKHSKTIKSKNKTLSDSKKLADHLGYYNMDFVCIHGIKYQSQSVGIRPHQKSLNLSCTAKLSVTYNRSTNMFKIVEFQAKHVDENGVAVHPLTEELFNMYSANSNFRRTNYLIPRVTIDNEGNVILGRDKNNLVKQAESFVKHSFKANSVKDFFQSEHNINLSTKYIHNLKNKISAVVRGEMSEDASFLKALEDDQNSDGGMIVEKYIVEGEVKMLYFQFSWMRHFFSQYPEHILIDATYCLVNTRMPLYIILAVDGMNQSFPVAFCLVANETKEYVEKFIQYFIRYNPDYINVKSFMTDKDLTEISVLKNYFPNSKSQLCLFHVLKSFKQMVNTSNIPHTMKDKAKSYLEGMAYAKDKNIFDQNFELFSSEFNGSKIHMHFLNRWLPCYESWVAYCRCNIFNMGDTTNNRIESLNQKLKQAISRYSRLCDFYYFLKSFLQRKIEKMLKSGFDQAYKKLHLTNSPIPKEIIDEVYSVATDSASKEIFSQMIKSLTSDCTVETMPTISQNKFNVKFETQDSNTDTSLFSCTCKYYLMHQLPCAHIFALRLHIKYNFFEANLVINRWRKEYYMQSLNNLKNSTKITPTELGTTTYYNRETEKYLQSSNILQKMSEILKSSGDTKFKERMKILENLVIEWSGSEKQITSDTSTKSNSPCPNEIHLECLDNDVTLHDITPISSNSLTTSPSIGKILFPTRVTVRGRPKGSVLTAIGKKRVAPKPSSRRKMKMLKFHTTIITNEVKHTSAPVNFDIAETQPNSIHEVNSASTLSSTHASKRDIESSSSATPIRFLYANLESSISVRHSQILQSHTWLDDEIINKSLDLLRRQHSLAGGLQNTLFSSSKPPLFRYEIGSFIQINNLDNQHWNTISGHIQDNRLIIDQYDSLYTTIHPDVISIASSLNRLYTNITKIIVRVHDVSQQPNGYNCGLYSIAYAKLLCAEKDPCKVTLIDNQLRSHLHMALQQNCLEEFPAIPRHSYSTPFIHEFIFDKVHCSCRKPVTDAMVQCVHCKYLFHHNCLKNRVTKRTINNFTCERCNSYNNIIIVN